MTLFQRLLPLVLGVFLLLGDAAAQSAVPTHASNARARLRQLPPLQRDEVLWLARCVYSESDRVDEQRLVAWVVRNRVETSYRGNTYRQVVLEPRQFSAFNEPTLRRRQILSFDENSASKAWLQALDVALDVYHAPASERPFRTSTRHFYSPVSMVGRSKPDWAMNASALSSTALGVSPYRFQFFDNLDENGGRSRALALDPPDRPISRVKSVGAEKTTSNISSERSRLHNPGFSGRVPLPTRSHLNRRSKQ